jgi:UDP-N-acetylmuramyl-tripeptide synthetase
VLADYPGLRGRLERVTPQGHPFSVFVDYAHTPDALHSVLRSLKPLVQAPGRLWVLFGCGGNRDRLKRPLMGREAALWADRLCVTSDNPRDEDPEAIIAEIRAGISEEALGRTEIEVDRREAIRICVDRLKAGDILLVAGKGHETYQVIGKERIVFDDVEVVKQCLN